MYIFIKTPLLPLLRQKVRLSSKPGVSALTSGCQGEVVPSKMTSKKISENFISLGK
jgi:hypothetical protein